MLCAEADKSFPRNVGLGGRGRLISACCVSAEPVNWSFVNFSSNGAEAAWNQLCAHRRSGIVNYYQGVYFSNEMEHHRCTQRSEVAWLCFPKAGVGSGTRAEFSSSFRMFQALVEADFNVVGFSARRWKGFVKFCQKMSSRCGETNVRMMSYFPLFFSASCTKQMSNLLCSTEKESHERLVSIDSQLLPRNTEGWRFAYGFSVFFEMVDKRLHSFKIIKIFF